MCSTTLGELGERDARGGRLGECDRGRRAWGALAGVGTVVRETGGGSPSVGTIPNDPGGDGAPVLVGVAVAAWNAIVAGEHVGDGYMFIGEEVSGGGTFCANVVMRLLALTKC